MPGKGWFDGKDIEARSFAYNIWKKYHIDIFQRRSLSVCAFSFSVPPLPKTKKGDSKLVNKPTNDAADTENSKFTSPLSPPFFWTNILSPFEAFWKRDLETTLPRQAITTTKIQYQSTDGSWPLILLLLLLVASTWILVIIPTFNRLQ